jgi:VanZ family protein
MANDNKSGVGDGATMRRNCIPAVLFTIAIVALSVWPRPPEPPMAFRFPHLDKVVHFLMYAVYAVVLAWTFRAGIRTWRIGVALLVYCTMFGVLMELIQATMPVLERTLSGMDMAANVAGSAAGVALYCGTVRRDLPPANALFR